MTVKDESTIESVNRLKLVFERYLHSLRFSTEPKAEGLEEAMRYALLADAKRIRPLLALGTARAIGVDPETVLPFAAGVEMIHTYSLIHDDLPAMDDDDLRRGIPTCHKRFGEDVAILAGDALYAEAFALILREQTGPPANILSAMGELAAATGIDGMVGGQYIDVKALADDHATLQRLHSLKTGRLIRACIECVVITFEGESSPRLPAIRVFTEELGLLFQIVDDILDVTGTDDSLGKPSGSDARHGKLTYVSQYGIERARELAARSFQSALQALDSAGGGRELQSLTELIYSRSS